MTQGILAHVGSGFLVASYCFEEPLHFLLSVWLLGFETNQTRIVLTTSFIFFSDRPRDLILKG